MLELHERDLEEKTEAEEQEGGWTGLLLVQKVAFDLEVQGHEGLHGQQRDGQKPRWPLTRSLGVAASDLVQPEGRRVEDKDGPRLIQEHLLCV